MDRDALIDAVLKLAHQDPFTLDQDEWSLVAKMLAFETQRQRNYIHNLREAVHLHEDCPGCPADAGEAHADYCADHPSKWPMQGKPGPTGLFLDDLNQLLRDCGSGVR